MTTLIRYYRGLKSVTLLVGRGVNVSLGRNVKRNDFFITLEQRNVERKRNFLRSNVIFTKMSRYARTKCETQFFLREINET
jgi:hypothetical protein